MNQPSTDTAEITRLVEASDLTTRARYTGSASRALRSAPEPSLSRRRNRVTLQLPLTVRLRLEPDPPHEPWPKLSRWRCARRTSECTGLRCAISVASEYRLLTVHALISNPGYIVVMVAYGPKDEATEPN